MEEIYKFFQEEFMSHCNRCGSDIDTWCRTPEDEGVQHDPNDFAVDLFVWAESYPEKPGCRGSLHLVGVCECELRFAGNIVSEFTGLEGVWDVKRRAVEMLPPGAKVNEFVIENTAAGITTCRWFHLNRDVKMRFYEVDGVIHDGAERLEHYEVVNLLNKLSEKAKALEEVSDYVEWCLELCGPWNEELTKRMKRIVELVGATTGFR